jgi:hypothetical protein
MRSPLPILYPILSRSYCYGCCFGFCSISLGEPFDKIVRVIAVVIAVLVLIWAIVGGQTAAMMGGGYLAHLDGAIGQVECRMDGERADAGEGWPSCWR